MINTNVYSCVGIKEVWQVPEENLTPGYIQHTVGWPLHESPLSSVYVGTFLYHMKPNLIQIGMIYHQYNIWGNSS